MDLLFVFEYKAPHKFPKENLHAGLHAMYLLNDVIRRSTVPTSPYEKYTYSVERLVCSSSGQPADSLYLTLAHEHNGPAYHIIPKAQLLATPYDCFCI